ncbi:HNH endonuclease [Phreatobacter sp. AB_2022a]|uniref:HNH endonuclease n=1 Tax=Phreatobacter sp. AB_2022a TaxID=3003134 RepID=UPI0022871600|nr:HNH endonuclease [Phreatobacter sp. AB_2022a]MCZ0732957.1 HNH endonuclease [Phreatobacter sp. AB_2022a]
MGSAIFMHRTDSIYDDSPSERYQFPRQYFGRVRQCIGDWIIYLEPTKVPGTRGYFAMAKVEGVVPDPTADGMFVALIEPGSYMEFPTSVPFRTNGVYVERGMLNERGVPSGRAQAAVRPLSSDDFNRIRDLGFDREDMLPRNDPAGEAAGFAEDQIPFQWGDEQDRMKALTSRYVRNAIFRKVVLRAYDERCAITGLKLINGGGRAEVQAAHIRPVGARGPDAIQNGIALSGTVHWMFDRGLISLSDDLDILISRKVNDVDSVRSIINRSGRARLPQRAADRPHPHFLNWHRENCFKQ